MKSNSCTIVSQGAGGYGQKKPMELFPARGGGNLLKIDISNCLRTARTRPSRTSRSPRRSTRVWHRPPHPISRRLVQTERDDDWFPTHVSSFGRESRECIGERSACPIHRFGRMRPDSDWNQPRDRYPLPSLDSGQGPFRRPLGWVWRIGGQ
jgi:hypothetical protein